MFIIFYTIIRTCNFNTSFSFNSFNYYRYFKSLLGLFKTIVIMEKGNYSYDSNRRKSRFFYEEEFPKFPNEEGSQNKIQNNLEPIPESPELIPATPAEAATPVVTTPKVEPNIVVPSNDYFEDTIYGIEDDIKSMFENVNGNGDPVEILPEIPNDIEKLKEQVKKEIEESSQFYKKNWNNQILLKEESYLKLSKIRNFGVGYRYENLINQMNLVQLLTQYVNESHQIRYTCRKIYFIETAVHDFDSGNFSLLNRFISNSLKTINQFGSDLKLKKKQWVWILSVYRQRFIYVKEKLKEKSELDGLYEIWRNIHDYDILYQFYCNHLIKN